VPLFLFSCGINAIMFYSFCNNVFVRDVFIEQDVHNINKTKRIFKLRRVLYISTEFGDLWPVSILTRCHSHANMLIRISPNAHQPYTLPRARKEPDLKVHVYNLETLSYQIKNYICRVYLRRSLIR